MSELSISCGARVDARDRGGCTPLHLAARNDHVQVASLLITCGAAVDARGDGHCTPLHMAAFRGHCSVMRLLISCGADLAARCHEQRTPLHWAAHEGHCDAIRLLVSCGADVNASPDECGTPLHIATFKGQCHAMLLLLEAGADVNARALTSAHSRDRQACIVQPSCFALESRAAHCIATRHHHPSIVTPRLGTAARRCAWRWSTTERPQRRFSRRTGAFSDKRWVLRYAAVPHCQCQHTQLAALAVTQRLPSRSACRHAAFAFINVSQQPVQCAVSHAAQAA